MLCSGRHRVIPAPGAQGKLPRYSVVYFVRPENNLAFTAVAEAFLARCLGGRAEPMTAEERQGTSMQVLDGAELVKGLQG